MPHARQRPHPRITALALLALLITLPPWAQAEAARESPVAQLEQFLADTTTFKSLFLQTVIDKAKGRMARSRGIIYLSRPSRLRLDYQSPVKKETVADGSTVTSYDHELKRFSQAPQEALFADTPARLLTRGEPLAKYFTAKDAGEHGGLEWVDLTPKDAKSPFKRVRVGFQIRRPVRLEMEEKEGALVQIDFLRPHINEPVEDAVFDYQAPPSYDVLRR